MTVIKLTASKQMHLDVGWMQASWVELAVMTGKGPSTITQKELLPVAVARIFGGGCLA